MTCLSRTYVQIGITIKHIFVSIFIKFTTELMNIIRKCNLGHEFLFCNVSKKKYKENKYISRCINKLKILTFSLLFEGILLCMQLICHTLILLPNKIAWFC